jgi:hypothetical protein
MGMQSVGGVFLIAGAELSMGTQKWGGGAPHGEEHPLLSYVELLGFPALDCAKAQEGLPEEPCCCENGDGSLHWYRLPSLTAGTPAGLTRNPPCQHPVHQTLTCA